MSGKTQYSLLFTVIMILAGCASSPPKMSGHSAEQQRQNAGAAHDELSREVNK